MINSGTEICAIVAEIMTKQVSIQIGPVRFQD